MDCQFIYVLVDAEREFAEKHGISIEYLQTVRREAAQGRVGKIEAAESDAPNTTEAKSSGNVSKIVDLGTTPPPPVTRPDP